MFLTKGEERKVEVCVLIIDYVIGFIVYYKLSGNLMNEE